MAVLELALVHKLSEFMAVQQKKFTYELMYLHDVSFVVQEYPWTVQEHFDG